MGRSPANAAPGVHANRRLAAVKGPAVHPHGVAASTPGRVVSWDLLNSCGRQAWKEWKPMLALSTAPWHSRLPTLDCLRSWHSRLPLRVVAQFFAGRRIEAHDVAGQQLELTSTARTG